MAIGGMSRRIATGLVTGVIVLGFFFTWFFGNFFYDLLWARLDAAGVSEGNVIASVTAHLVPFLLSALLIIGLYFFVRYELELHAGTPLPQPTRGTPTGLTTAILNTGRNNTFENVSSVGFDTAIEDHGEGNRYSDIDVRHAPAPLEIVVGDAPIFRCVPGTGRSSTRVRVWVEDSKLRIAKI